jgi:hypothetical protein
MDSTIKFLLGVIAASLVMLNLQLAGVSLVKDAHAEDSLSDLAFTINLMARDVAAIRNSLPSQVEVVRTRAYASLARKSWAEQILPMCIDSPTCRHFNPHITKENLQKVLDNADQ